MKGLNKIMLVGRLGLEPDFRVSSSGNAMANLSVATSDRVKAKGSNEYKDETDWHRVVVFGKTAEFVKSYANKGDLVYVEGKVKYSKYQDKETGKDRTSTQIICYDLQLLSKASQNAAKREEPKPFSSPVDDDSDIPF